MENGDAMSDHCCSPHRDGGGATPGPAAPDPTPATDGRLPGLVDVPGGVFLMGSDDALAYPADGEGPVREVGVDAFSIAATAVTNEQFARFVDATGHVTDAEQFGDSLVFVGLLAPDAPPTRAVAAAPWWRQVPGASWRAPEGPGSTVEGREDHPVVHVSHRDAVACAAWAGGRLPTEPEWELAARGGLVQQPYPWGSEREPGGVARMKTFAGTFPGGPSEPVGTAPVDAYEPNGFGLSNTTGNVWEWTSGSFTAGDPRFTLRGGSYLCHDSYCRRYRVSARTGNTADTSLGHTGFRLVRA
ncbi:formylglycine-generating enzyme family protein [Aeromicrobium sp. CF4.19]|uniref:formylglycine-generating enzyme family protein n=1 Tax=Aeromicrobium sp. CF4.19 TaxID=3373082 RepID=UPI003EE55E97